MVVDASVWVSRLVPADVHHLASRHWLERHAADGGQGIAPLLLLPEVAGAIARRTGRPALARRAVQRLLRVPSLRLVPIDEQLGLLAARLAADLGLRGADSLYVALARSLDVPLITWDQDQQARAAGLIRARTPATAT